MGTEVSVYFWHEDVAAAHPYDGEALHLEMAQAPIVGFEE